ncbi:MAG: murein L,D-transpeptidase catalytic domain family protein [Chitinophagales bacterium]|nr:murein L,D-transpeptidase catalytic domain family protein [Chitinophagales bacterium]
MRRVYIFVAVLAFFSTLSSSESKTDDTDVLQKTLQSEIEVKSEESDVKSFEKIFSQLPENSVSWEAFLSAMSGRAYLQTQDNFTHNNVLTIVDFSKPSTEERFFVIDIEKEEILFSSLTAHGQGTGDNMATRFSNLPDSHQSSLGFYKTGEIYYGRHGRSMFLNGLEKGINDKARERAIVVHAAEYVSPSFIAQHGRLGRSFGCPALPPSLNEAIIKTISGGTLFYIYAPDQHYMQTSQIMQSSQLFATLQ